MSEKQPSQRTGNAELIDEAADTLGLDDDVRETATVLYRRIYEDDLYHGRTLETVLAGTMYVSCRVVGKAANPTRIAEELDTSREDVLGTARHLMKSLNIELQPIEPAPYIDEFVEALDLSDDLREVALDIVETCRDAGMHSGKSPTGFAAGAVYAASTITGERVTQEDIRTVSDVSTVTIRNRYKAQLECYESNRD